MESAALARQAFGKREARWIRFEPAQHAVERLDRNRQAVGVPQPLGERVAARARRTAKSRNDGLRRVLKLREMICVAVEEVARLLIRQQYAPAGRQLDGTGVLACDAPGAV